MLGVLSNFATFYIAWCRVAGCLAIRLIVDNLFSANNYRKNTVAPWFVFYAFYFCIIFPVGWTDKTKIEIVS
jgi:hypothetical protein